MVQSDGTARAANEAPTDAEALDFVRFCHRRKHVGWPELYDEMPTLAGLVSRVVAEDQERRRRQESVRAVVVAAAPLDQAMDLLEPAEPAMAEAVPVSSSPGEDTSPRTAEPAAATERVATDHGSIRIAVAAGA